MSRPTEKRRSRESFTRALERICRSLDECNEKVVESRSFIFRDEVDQATVRIDSIWVVGSYARGAMSCGDLDLVVDMTAIHGALPFSKAVAKSFFGVLPLVRYYQGRPEKNTSGVAFADAILVWEPGFDWGNSLRGIVLDPLAGPASRETDEIPFRLEQLRSDPEVFKDLISLKNQKQYEWEFLPIGKGDLLSFDPAQDLREAELSVIQWANMQMGAKSRQLIPALIRFLQQRDPQWIHRAPPYITDRSVMHCGSTVFYLGTPPLDLHRFVREPGVRQVALVPHLSARGPNGIWVIRRGPSHPDLLAAKGVKAYYLTEDNSPVTVIACGSNLDSGVTLIELATSHQAAERLVDDLYDEGERRPEISCAEGAELLKVICGVDVVDIFEGGRAYALTHQGRSHVSEWYGYEGPVSPLEEIARALRSQTPD